MVGKEYRVQRASDIDLITVFVSWIRRVGWQVAFLE